MLPRRVLPLFLLLLAAFVRPSQAVNVDFLWIIDNSPSMADEQGLLASAADEIAARLANATCPIDWRIAVTYTDLHNAPGTTDICPGAPGPGRRRLCPFTRSIEEFRDGTPECAYVRAGTCGDGSERGFYAAAEAIRRFIAGAGCEPVPGGECTLRPDARLAIIFFTDTGEGTRNSSPPPGQPDGSVASWAAYFRDYDLLASGTQRAQVHGVLCPDRPTPENPAPCSDGQSNPALYDRYSDVIRLLGGTEASIRDDAGSPLSEGIDRIVRAAIADACCGDGTLQGTEECDDGNLADGDCCSLHCRYEPATTVCRPAAGACDVAELCSGVSSDCPPDVLRPAMHSCRPPAGACDDAEFCTGTSAACPADTFRPAGVECRAPADPCDVVEMCSGQSPSCPVDRRLTGLAAMSCLCHAGLNVPDCAGASIPRTVMRRFGRACRRVARAETASGARAQRLLFRAQRGFDRTARSAAKAGRRNRIAPACATALVDTLYAAEGFTP